MKQTKKKRNKGNFLDFWKKYRPEVLVLVIALVLFIAGWHWAAPDKDSGVKAEAYAEYEMAQVVEVLADDTELDPVSDGGWRGEQLLLAEVTSGQYKGQVLQVGNFVGPLYGGPVQAGDGVVLLISTDADGTYRGTVYEFNRALPLAIVVLLFLIAAIVVGGKTGAKSLVGLAVTLACLFGILIPALMKGAPTLPLVFATCAFIAVVSLTILGGIQKKTVCAMLGVIAGTALALFFGLAAQWICRIDGLRAEDVEPLLQLRQTGVPIGLTGLLVGGVVISALGAVMDVAMGISSSLTEVYAADNNLTRRELFRSGMNIGRDMVGTMTNTLILAFLGSSFVLILYLYSMDLAFHQLLSSAFLATEVISSVSSSIGVILSIPITALITAVALAGGGKTGTKMQ